MDATATDSETPDALAPDAGFSDSGLHPDAMIIDDDNDSFAEAQALTLGQNARGVINPPGDHDFYRFEANAGTWLIVFTNANPASDPGRVDTVVTLYDAAMQQIAENDDAIPRVSPDSELIYRVPETGTYFIEVQEFSTWRGETPEGSRTYTYELAARALDPPANPFITEDPETGDDAASARDLRSGTGETGIILGTFRDAADLDVFRVMLGPAPTRIFNVLLMPVGPDGYGSTATPGAMWLTRGSTITARARPPIGQLELQPPAEGGENRLWIAQGGRPAGANDFYVFKTSFTPENPAEMREPNNTLATAERLNPAGMPRRAFVLATLGDGDIDYFAFDVMNDERLTFACGAQSSPNSGVVDLLVEVRDRSDTTLAMATETATRTAFRENLTLTSTTHYLRLSKGGQDPEVRGTWVRCGITLAPP